MENCQLLSGRSYFSASEFFSAGEFFRRTVFGYSYFSVVRKMAENHGGFLPHPKNCQLSYSNTKPVKEEGDTSPFSTP